MAVRLAPTMTTSLMGTPDWGPAPGPGWSDYAAIWCTAANPLRTLRARWRGCSGYRRGMARSAGIGKRKSRRERRLLSRGSDSAPPVEQLASDQHAPDLVGARADRIELGIAQDAAGGEFVDVAVAAQRLDAFQSDLHRGFGGMQQAGSGIDAALVAGVVVAGDLVGERARGLQGCVHVGDLALHQAEGADGAVELPALTHIGQGEVERGLHQAERATGQHEAFGVEARHQDLDA